MLIKGEDFNKIKDPSSSLSDDQLHGKTFDYIISNPPYGTKWEKDKRKVMEEHELGFDGRFGAGTPRINDGQLLFIQHMISKMHTNGEPSRIACITNGSPLFTGDAGSGESEIRKWIIENDYLESIIALPDQLFYNTGIHTYIWIISNNKPENRKHKIQLIDGREFYNKMRKSLGNKRNYLNENDIDKILDLYTDFKQNSYSQIFESKDFGYTKVRIERPLQRNYSCKTERLENLFSYSGFYKLTESKAKDPIKKLEEEKGKKLQNKILESLKTVGTKIYRDVEQFKPKVEEALSWFKTKRPSKKTFVKKIVEALSEHDDKAEYVTTKSGKKKPDPDLRDYEKIPLAEDIEEYFLREVKPYYPQAWMDRKKDRVGFEINFTQYFYEYTPPRPVSEIQKDIEKITKEILELEKEEL